MSVSLTQKGTVAQIAIAVDCSSILDSFQNSIDALESQRESALGDKVSNGILGTGLLATSTPLTQGQINVVNSQYDGLIIDEKRNLQIKLLDLARQELSKSIDAVAFSDADISTEKVSRKAKVDAELDAVVAAKPTVDSDAITAVAISADAVVEVKG